MPQNTRKNSRLIPLDRIEAVIDHVGQAWAVLHVAPEETKTTASRFFERKLLALHRLAAREAVRHIPPGAPIGEAFRRGWAKPAR